MSAVTALCHYVGKKSACEALSIPRTTYYRHSEKQGDAGENKRPVPPLALAEYEQKQVLDELHSKRFWDSSPSEVYATLLDEGTYLCSIRTMYRILDKHNEVRERRKQVNRPHYEKPELLATAPNQVWSWDISVP
jgi:putative transposase